MRVWHFHFTTIKLNYTFNYSKVAESNNVPTFSRYTATQRTFCRDVLIMVWLLGAHSTMSEVKYNKWKIMIVPTCRSKSNPWRYCEKSVRRSSRFQNPRAGPTRANRTSDRMPEALWTCPTVTDNINVTLNSDLMRLIMYAEGGKMEKKTFYVLESWEYRADRSYCLAV